MPPLVMPPPTHLGVGGPWKPVAEAPEGTVALVCEPGSGMEVARKRGAAWFTAVGSRINATHWAELPPWPARNPLPAGAPTPPSMPAWEFWLLVALSIVTGLLLVATVWGSK